VAEKAIMNPEGKKRPKKGLLSRRIEKKGVDSMKRIRKKDQSGGEVEKK